MIHNLKTDPVSFEAAMKDEKRFEIRKNDRGFKRGFKVDDYLVLQEYVDGSLTGREGKFAIPYIFKGGSCGLMDDYVAMTIIRMWN